jgi:hippurate hydrolase
VRYVESRIIKVNSTWWVKNTIFQKFDFAEKAIEPFGRYGHPYILEGICSDRSRKRPVKICQTWPTPHGIPYAVWFCGDTDAEKWDDAARHEKLDTIPRNHSGHFAPVIQPTLRTSVDAMSLAVLTFLSNGSSPVA